MPVNERDFEDLVKKVDRLIDGVGAFLKEREAERAQQAQERLRAQTREELQAVLQSALTGFEAKIREQVRAECERLGFCTPDQARQIAEALQTTSPPAGAQAPEEKEARAPEAERPGHRTVQEFLDCPDCGPEFRKAFNKNPLAFLSQEGLAAIRDQVVREMGEPEKKEERSERTAFL